MIRLFHWFWQQAHLLLRKISRRPYRAYYVDDIPDLLHAHVVYIVGENQHLWSAIMLCPCGCKQPLYLPLTKEDLPRWIVVVESDKTVSLSPSIRRTVGCKSHFYLIHGSIKWCK